METYRNWHPVAYRSSAYAPVPGWGMQPIMAGSRIIAIGGLGNPLDAMTSAATDQVWAQLQPKLRAELQAAVTEVRDEMRRDLMIGAGLVITAVGLAALWGKKR